MGKRVLLDCTLRDGGYVNNWEFDRETAAHIMEGLYMSGIRLIEIGIMGKDGIPGRSTKFSDFSQIEPLLEHRKKDCRYAVMLNQAEAADYDLPARSENTVDMIRIAFFKPEAAAALRTAAELLEKGYDVLLQAMATFMYQEPELAALIASVNKTRPDGFYMVDSFSTMYRRDVRAMADNVLERLDKNILFGFHAHNNIQMAYANAIEFLTTETDRTLMADGSIYGMGRGAGNVPIELLMEFFNKFHGASYDVMGVLALFQEDIRPIFHEYYWGYSPEYFLTAIKDTNSAYGWYLKTRGITDLRDYNAILDTLPAETRYTLSRAAADAAIRERRREGKAHDGTG